MGKTLKLHRALANKTRRTNARWFIVLCCSLGCTSIITTTKWTVIVQNTVYSSQQSEIQILDLAPPLPNATKSGTFPNETSTSADQRVSLLTEPQQEKENHPTSQSPPEQLPQRGSTERVQHTRHQSYSTRVVTTKKRLRLAERQHKPQYGKVLYFLHIHKAGGTFFCSYILQNHVHASKRDNCNVQPDFYCCGKEDTMEAQIQFANTTEWDLVATERDMYEHMPVDYYTYIVSLRQSKERYYSHWAHLRQNVENEVGIIDSSWLFEKISVRKIRKRNRPHLGNFSEWWAGQPDNWNTRILCGPKCRPRPKYQISRDQFVHTLQRLEKFSFVLFVEDMEGSYDRIASAYNWTRYRDVIRGDFLEKKGNQNAYKKPSEIPLSLEPWDPLMSALDDALYEFAQRKNRGEDDLWRPFSNQEALDAYFRDGPAQHFIHICGASCTPY